MSNTQSSEKEATAVAMGIGSIAVTQIPLMLDLAVTVSPKITLCFVGDTGIGKTPLVHAWAKARGAACHVLNFGHMTPQDISMMLFAEDGSDYGPVPPRWMKKINADAADKEKYPGGAVWFIDELNRAHIDLINAMFTLTDDRRVHDFMLHDDVLIVAAMNPSTDGHTVTKFEKDPALRKRLSFVHVTEDLDGWIAHAKASGFPETVIHFLQAQGEDAFYNRVLRAAGKTFSTPAAWDKACRILMADGVARGSKPGFSASAKMMLRGTLGHDVANALVTFDLERAFTPQKVFEATLPGTYESLLVLNDKVPNDPRLTAFRVTTAQWVRDRAIGVPVDGELDMLLAAERLRGYVSKLTSEQVSAFMGDVGQAVRTMAPGHQAKAWEEVTRYYAEIGLDPLLRQQVQNVSEG